MSRTKRIVISTLILVLTGATAFVLLNSFFPHDIVAQHQSEGKPSYRVVATKGEAESIAGRQVSTPRFLPEGLERGNILLRIPANSKESVSVDQYWSFPDGSGGLSIEDDPDLDGLASGEPFTIRGIEGERALSTRDPTRGGSPNGGGRPYDILAFYWKDEHGGHLVTGSLVGSITEESLLKVVESIEMP